MRKRFARWLGHALTGHEWRLIIGGTWCTYCHKHVSGPGIQGWRDSLREGPKPDG